MRSMAMRMFCWRSVSSGSRRKAFCPPVRRPKMAPLTMRVITIATSSSIMLKPACRGSAVFIVLSLVAVEAALTGTPIRASCTSGRS